MIYFLLLLLLCRVQSAIANTEKVIFLGPSSLQIPVQHPTLEDLQLEALTPQLWSLRTHIQAEFPTNTSRYGQSSWYLLHGLQEGQRYEVRICWAATVSSLRGSRYWAHFQGTNFVPFRYLWPFNCIRNSRVDHFLGTILRRTTTRSRRSWNSKA